MKTLFTCIIGLGLIFPITAQITDVQKLDEVVVVATNYKYFNQVDSKQESIPVKMLEAKVATYNLKDSPYYQDDYVLYYINFFIPEGSILAAYDRDGNIVRTIERFKDIRLPNAVILSLAKQYPNWAISKDVYLVSYKENKGVDKKYKIRLTNKDKRIWIKTDETGKFL
jgi:hypothetical protein